MKIAIVSSMFPPLQSGSSHYAATIADGLGKRGHDVLVISSRLSPKQPRFTSYRHLSLPTMLIPSTPISHGYRLPYCFYPMSIPLVNGLLKKFQPDVIHANGHFLNVSWIAASTARSLRIPLVLTVHTKLVHTNRVLNAVMRYTDRSMLRRIWQNTDSAIALDRQMARYISDSLNIDFDRIHSIPLAIDIDNLLSYNRLGGDWLRRITSNRVILSVSHLTALKSPLTLLKAFSMVAQETDDVDIVFIGRLHSSEPVDAAKNLRIESRTHFAGEVPHSLIPSLLSHSLLEVHSLDSRTGFDNASIEAMVMGVPVISCVRPDNFGRPWLIDGENVLLVKPRSVSETAEALRKVVLDARLRRRLSENAKSSARRFFSHERLLDDLESLYSSITAD